MHFRANLVMLALSLLPFGVASAQDVLGDMTPMDGLEIRGVVIEPGPKGSVMPVAGVEITLTEFKLVEMMVTPTVIAKIATDNQGTFLFKPTHLGRYIVDAKKEGYRTTGAILPGQATNTYPTLTREEPKQRVSFSISRAGSLTGRVVDEDNKPIAGMKLELRGGPIGVYPATTDERGVFLVNDVIPNKYLVRAVPRTLGARLEESFTEDDLKVVDQDLDTSYWPGGPGVRPAPMEVLPGALADIGSLRATKIAYFRAHVKVSATCEADETWVFREISIAESLGLQAPSEELITPLEVRCDQAVKNGFLVRNLPQGSYWFSLSRRTRDAVMNWALERVEISRENVVVEMHVTPSSELTGRVIPPEGSKVSDVRGLMVAARPLVSTLSGGVVRPIDPTGQFKMTLPGPQQQIQLMIGNGSGSNIYVQQIRFNGQPVTDGLLPLDSGAPAQVDIVLDDRGGTVRGSILDGDKPAPLDARALMMKWPIPAGSPVPASYRLLFSGERPSDIFEITGLAPGEYRLFAVTREAFNSLYEPGVLERAGEHGQKIVIERGGSQNVSAKLLDLSKI